MDKNYEIEVKAQNNCKDMMVIVEFRPPVVRVHTIQIFADLKADGAAETAGFEWARDRIEQIIRRKPKRLKKCRAATQTSLPRLVSTSMHSG